MTETQPTKPSTAQALASVLRRCQAGIASSRAQLDKVEETLGKLVAMADKKTNE